MNEDTMLKQDDNHLKYVENLPNDVKNLIFQRDLIYSGSWSKLEEKISSFFCKCITELKNYETRNEIDLGYYLRLYLKNKTQ